MNNTDNNNTDNIDNTDSQTVVTWITIEVGGGTIAGASRVATKMANLLNCMVVFNFSGIKCIASPNKDYTEVVERYLHAAEARHARRFELA